MTKHPSQRLGQAVDAQGHQHTLRFHGEGENAATITRSPEATDTLQMQVAPEIYRTPATTPEEASEKLQEALEGLGLRLTSLSEKIDVRVIIQYDQWPNPTKLTNFNGGPREHEGLPEVLRDVNAVIDDVFQKYEGQRVTSEVLEAAYSEIHSRIERGEWPWKDRFKASPGCIVWGTKPTTVKP